MQAIAEGGLALLGPALPGRRAPATSFLPAPSAGAAAGTGLAGIVLTCARRWVEPPEEAKMDVMSRVVVISQASICAERISRMGVGMLASVKAGMAAVAATPLSKSTLQVEMAASSMTAAGSSAAPWTCA